MLRKGHRVTVIDDLSTGSAENISQHFENSNFTFLKYDITNYIHIEDHIDTILHFASPASPIDYQQAPIATLKTGSLGTHKALGLALAHNATFLLASTSEVYGDPLVHPQTEDYWGNVNPIGPRSMYDEAKRFAEAFTMAYHNAHGLETRIVRIFNTYGPRMRMHDGRVVPAMICQALSGQPLTVFGDGSQTRSFCYISDEVDGIYRLANSTCSTPVNIGNPHEMTVLEFAETILRITKSHSPIEYHPLPIDDPHKRQPDITKAKAILDWEPKVTLEEGLAHTIEYFRAKLEDQRPSARKYAESPKSWV